MNRIMPSFFFFPVQLVLMQRRVKILTCFKELWGSLGITTKLEFLLKILERDVYAHVPLSIVFSLLFFCPIDSINYNKQCYNRSVKPTAFVPGTAYGSSYLENMVKICILI